MADDVSALYHRGLDRIYEELERSKRMAADLKDKPGKEEQHEYWNDKRVTLDWAYNVLLGHRRSP